MQKTEDDKINKNKHKMMMTMMMMMIIYDVNHLKCRACHDGMMNEWLNADSSTYNALILDGLELVRVDDGEDGDDEGIGATHNSREACPEEGLEQSVDSSCKE